MVNVIWYNGCRGNWDHGLLMDVFDKYPDLFIQHNNRNVNFIYPNKSIVIVSGKPDVEGLRYYLSMVNFCILILTSEEDSFFDYKSVIHPGVEVWTQYYYSNKSDIKERMLIGPPNRLSIYKIKTDLNRKYLWSFVGQVQNPSRQKAVEVLKTIPHGFMHIADSFGGVENGIVYQEYLDIMCQSIFVICPSGSMCVDSFRLYEAMECGAIPITEVKSPRDEEGFNFWNEVYPQNEVIAVRDWEELHAIINPKDNFQRPDWIINNKWYFNYKLELEQKLLNYANRD